MRKSSTRLFWLIPVILLSIGISSCSYKVYVVRHAEKAEAPASDPPLTAAGQARAEQLAKSLSRAKIKMVWSTNYLRTKNTAEPLAKKLGLPIQTYSPKPDSAFIQKVISFKKNQLIVGHSNTIDDIVNMLSNSKAIAADIDEKVYDNLFIVKLPGRRVVMAKQK